MVGAEVWWEEKSDFMTTIVLVALLEPILIQISVWLLF
jgi:hypothetical protein